MNKAKLLSIISISFLFANIVLIWFLITQRQPQSRREGPKKVIIEKLQFDEVQTKGYEKLIDWHKENIRKAEQQMMELKNQLYSGLAQELQNNLTDSLIAEIGNVQIVIENINYRHFQEIMQLCNPEQMNSFNDLCRDIAKLFSPGRMPPNEK